MSQEDEVIKEFRLLYFQLEENSRLKGTKPVFKITPKGSKALTELTIPFSERTFRELVENLHILINEGSGNRNRLPLKLDEKRVSQDVKLLRNYYVHDQSHGTPSEIRRKHKRIGELFFRLIGTNTPGDSDQWRSLGYEIFTRMNTFLKQLVKHYPNYDNYYEGYTSKYEHHFEHDITLFPDERVPYYSIKKTGMLGILAEAPVFVPHLSLTPTPEFGYGTNHAIHFTSTAYNATIEQYEKFLDKIQSLWEKSIYNTARDTRTLYSWSISSDGEMKFGSGFPNLLKAIKNTDIGIVTIFLIGCYGEDYSKSFFVVISNYWKYDFFRDNQLDVYLSNMPLDFGWVEDLNESMKLLSDSADIAESYSLKPILSRRWISKKQGYDIQDKLIGGIGRDGYEDRRDWDRFVGLIMENPFTSDDFELEEHYSFDNQRYPDCPIDCFDTIVMSVTNSPPEVEEILSKKFKGVFGPSIRHLILDGYGHEIHALLFWGGSISDR